MSDLIELCLGKRIHSFMSEGEQINEDANFQAIFRYYEQLMTTKSEDYAAKRVRLRLPIIPVAIFGALCKRVEQLFMAEPNILRITSPVVIVGDLQGHLLDLLRIISKVGLPIKTQYLFLGNIVDRGQFSLETIGFLYTMKVLFPENVHIIRGFHEFREVSETNGFLSEIMQLYENRNLFTLFLRAFSYTPYAAILDGNKLCVNAGFGPNIPDIQTINTLKRPLNVFNTSALVELMWSDPTDALPMFLPSSRGYGNLFGAEATQQFLKANKMAYLIRSHQVVNGVQHSFNQQLVTVFSASNYCDQENNKSGILVIRSNDCYVEMLEPLPYLKREDVNFIKSDSETIFQIPQIEQMIRSGISTRRMASGRMLLNNGLRVSSANHTISEPMTKSRTFTNCGGGIAGPQHKQRLPRKSMEPLSANPTKIMQLPY